MNYHCYGKDIDVSAVEIQFVNPLPSCDFAPLHLLQLSSLSYRIWDSLYILSKDSDSYMALRNGTATFTGKLKIFSLGLRSSPRSNETKIARRFSRSRGTRFNSFQPNSHPPIYQTIRTWNSFGWWRYNQYYIIYFIFSSLIPNIFCIPKYNNISPSRPGWRSLSLTVKIEYYQ